MCRHVRIYVHGVLMDEHKWDLSYIYSPFYVTQSIAYLFHPVSVSSNIFYEYARKCFCVELYSKL